MVPVRWDCTPDYSMVPVRWDCTPDYSVIPTRWGCTPDYSVVPVRWGCTSGESVKGNKVLGAQRKHLQLHARGLLLVISFCTGLWSLEAHPQRPTQDTGAMPTLVPTWPSAVYLKGALEVCKAGDCRPWLLPGVLRVGWEAPSLPVNTEPLSWSFMGSGDEGKGNGDLPRYRL